MNWNDPQLADLITRALAEDVGPGDLTTGSLFQEPVTARARFVSREDGVLAGLPLVERIFQRLDPNSRLEVRCQEGGHMAPGKVLAVIEADRRALLVGERLALNFLQRMSGIATQTARFVEAVAGLPVTILDTRKTAPGLRALDKYAVRMGGGTNHRLGLFDQVLIKDNHIALAGGLARAVSLARTRVAPGTPIEVEAGSIEQVQEALEAGADRILADNMPLDVLRKAVRLVGGRVPVEASGSIRLDTVRLVAETGVQYISVGALTHSVRALDIAMKLAS